MRKLYLVTAILALLSVGVFAQSTSPSSQQPITSPTGTQAQASQAMAIEGCLGGSAGSFSLTDGSGKTYQLAGDTAKLGDHVGHTLRIWGSQKEGGASADSAAASAHPTFTVQKVKMVSSSCSTSK